MYKIISNSKKAYGVKAVVADTVADLESIEIGSFSTGSNAFVFETLQNYILSPGMKWIPVASSSSSSNSNSSSSTSSDNDDEDSDYAVVDGGNASGV